jgi:hypothetical protein
VKTVCPYTKLMEAIEAHFGSEAALDDLERQVSRTRLDATDHEHVLRRIPFYRSDFHLRVRDARRSVLSVYIDI